ncbi:MAG: hypothetical protein AB7I98_16520 [Verrucomicrobiales bacterium]|nr:hypothetical protein [Verrucomicrobiae bacterium]
MKLKPEFVKEIKEANDALEDQGIAKELPKVEGVARMWKTECPRLAILAEREGILLELANVLTDRAWEAAKTQPGDFSENMKVAEMGLIPWDRNTEAEFLSHHIIPQVAATTT